MRKLKLGFIFIGILAIMLTGCAKQNDTAGAPTGQRFLANEADYSKVGQCILATTATQFSVGNPADYYNLNSPWITNPASRSQEEIRRNSDYHAIPEQQRVKYNQCPQGTKVAFPMSVDRDVRRFREDNNNTITPLYQEVTVNWACYGPCSLLQSKR